MGRSGFALFLRAAIEPLSNTLDLPGKDESRHYGNIAHDEIAIWTTDRPVT